MTTSPKPSPQLIETVTTIANALYAQGDSFDLGCAESEIDNMLQKANDIFPGKKRRVVADWQWWDVLIPDNSKLPDQYLPAILYASNVLQDESYRFREGDWVRSTFLLKMHSNCIFETDNTFYIMVGKGTRKMVDVKTIMMLC
jgi:hypothetical protein